MTDLLARIEAIEARQRDHNMHDPDCPRRITDRANAWGQMYYTPGECNCWLDGENHLVARPAPPDRGNPNRVS